MLIIAKSCFDRGCVWRQSARRSVLIEFVTVVEKSQRDSGAWNKRVKCNEHRALADFWLIIIQRRSQFNQVDVTVGDTADEARGMTEAAKALSTRLKSSSHRNNWM